MTKENFNLYSRFAPSLAKRSDEELLTTADGTVWTGSEIEQTSARIAAGLSLLGVQRGDRVSVQVAKSPEALCLYLACLRAGFVFHPLNTAYKANELEYFFGNAEPAAVVFDSHNRSMIEPLACKAGATHLLTLDADGSSSLMQLAEKAKPDFPVVHSEADELATLLYSSGTTGVPKGIMLTHGNLLSNSETLVEAWSFTEYDRLLHALPIFHVHGLFVALGCVLLTGAQMRWLPALNIDQIIEYLPECTVLMGVPTYYTRLLADERLTPELASSIRVFISGSAPLLAETFSEFEQRTGHRILERYGMTETNMNTSNPLNGARKPGTVGPPLPGVEVRIRDDQGRPAAEGEVGSVEVRGDNVFSGYWKLPEKTAEDFTDDGFFITGDQGFIDSEGYVSLVGRAKDMVISGGLNVYPKEVELFVDTLPGVKESAVIGSPHPDFGEGVVAIVVGEDSDALPDARCIIDACKEALADFKVPKAVFFVDELPRNTMGKVQKNLLRESYADTFTG